MIFKVPSNTNHSMCQKVDSVLTDAILEPMPAGSKMDPPLATAKPIGDGRTASGITYLRREKKAAVQQQRERGVRICERNNSADTKVSEQGGVEVLQAPEQRFPCSPR
ncbi:hypothetical protein QYF61_005286 [Mycteria americana]|uniref:Uncharacterized protein n=1 Tax=Mycteria americana TaxID=33587 RepID=A0AAN7NKL2_MYCAM|nr:hypothetical protein QYF61_005286 [Mycteria americana]